MLHRHPFLRFFVFLVPLVMGRPLHAQLQLDSLRTPEQLVQDLLVGPGVLVSNVVFNGQPGNTQDIQVAGFDATATTFPLDSGLLLCTGRVGLAAGPNDWGSAFAEVDGNFISEPDLDLLCNDISMDCAVLEFDLVPNGDSIRFTFSFASEEYLEYANSGYNDVFGFFLSGPGISGPYTNGAINLALVPGTSDVVSVNTINDVFNTSYYVDNGDGSTSPFDSAPQYIQFDGFTAPLVAGARVECGSTYHIKLAIGDVGDPNWDSGIFLLRNSFTAVGGGGLVIHTPQDNGLLSEGCGTAVATLSRAGTTGDQVVPITVSGGAAAVDVSGIPASVTIPDGQSSVQFAFTAIADGLAEGSEGITLSAELLGACGGASTSTASISLTDGSSLTVSATAPVAPCTGQPVQLDATAQGGSGPITFLWSNGQNGASITVPSTSATYTVTATDTCAASATATVPITGGLTVELGPDTTVCAGQPVALVTDAIDVSYAWSTGADGPAIEVEAAGTYVLVIERDGCTASDSVQVNVEQPPSFDHAASICTGGTLRVVLPPALANTRWWDGDSSRTRAFDAPGTYAFASTYGPGCALADAITVVDAGSGPAFAPNAFTPDGDGINDVFAVAGHLDAGAQLDVYDRWGALIATSTAVPPVWDGSVQGTLAPNAVYVYRLSYTSHCADDRQQQLIGHVSLLR